MIVKNTPTAYKEAFFRRTSQFPICQRTQNKGMDKPYQTTIVFSQHDLHGFSRSEKKAVLRIAKKGLKWASNPRRYAQRKLKCPKCPNKTIRVKTLDAQPEELSICRRGGPRLQIYCDINDMIENGCEMDYKLTLCGECGQLYFGDIKKCPLQPCVSYVCKTCAPRHNSLYHSHNTSDTCVTCSAVTKIKCGVRCGNCCDLFCMDCFNKHLSNYQHSSGSTPLCTILCAKETNSSSTAPSGSR